MRIAPGSHFRTRDIALRDIDTSRETDLSVHDQNLAVVAVIDPAGEPRENHRHEALHLHARLAEPSHELAAEAPAAHIVVDEPHLHAFGGLFDQDIGDLAPQLVVFDDVILQMDRRACSAKGRPDFVERLGPVVEYPHPVADGQQRLVVVEQQRDDIAVIDDLGPMQQSRAVDFEKLLPTQRVEAFDVLQPLAAEEFFLAVIAAEHDVEHEPHAREQRDDDDPREGFDRVSFVMDDDRDGQNDEKNIPETQKRLQVRQTDGQQNSLHIPKHYGSICKDNELTRNRKALHIGIVLSVSRPSHSSSADRFSSRERQLRHRTHDTQNINKKKVALPHSILFSSKRMPKPFARPVARPDTSALGASAFRPDCGGPQPRTAPTSPPFGKVRDRDRRKYLHRQNHSMHRYPETAGFRSAAIVCRSAGIYSNRHVGRSPQRRLERGSTIADLGAFMDIIADTSDEYDRIRANYAAKLENRKCLFIFALSKEFWPGTGRDFFFFYILLITKKL